MNKWKDELGHMEMGNKWLAYNAIQSFNQHEQGKGDRSEEKSLLRALDGKLGFSDKALKMLNNSIKEETENLNHKKIRKFKNKIIKYQEFIKNNFEYVGENFAYEARSIHYNTKKKSKGIYGKATNDEVKSLNEEGIETQTIPWIKDKDN